MLSAVMQGNDQRMKLNVKQHKFLEENITPPAKVLQIRHGKSVLHICSLVASWDIGFGLEHWTQESKELKRLKKSNNDHLGVEKT